MIITYIYHYKVNKKSAKTYLSKPYPEQLILISQFIPSGEHVDSGVDPAGTIGLSPLSRGTLFHGVTFVAQIRFIPALAGNTRAQVPVPTVPPVYPRSRGEHAFACAACSRPAGLSPLSRGTRNSLHCSLLKSPVYPRSRGEHSPLRTIVISISGLSPLSRGTLDLCCSAIRILRFIPALAGNTSRRNSPPNCRAVYPRSRGEHGTWQAAIAPGLGLSPLSRGTPHQCCAGRKPRRFIPALAGNTLSLCLKCIT